MVRSRGAGNRRMFGLPARSSAGVKTRQNLIWVLNSRSHPMIETKLPPVFLSIPLRRVKCVFHKVNPSELMAWGVGIQTDRKPHSLQSRRMHGTHEDRHTRRSLLHRFRWSWHRKGVDPTADILTISSTSSLVSAHPPADSPRIQRHGPLDGQPSKPLGWRGG